MSIGQDQDGLSRIDGSLYSVDAHALACTASTPTH
ncbi:hypothetical protein, partial [Mycobacterium lacus]